MRIHLFKSLTLSASTALLFGCGGSDDPTPASIPPPAATAVATADAYTLDWNAAKRLSVQDNDTSSNGTPVLSVTETPKNGTVKVDGAALVYTPNTGFFGIDSLRYQLANGSAISAAAVALKVEAAVTLQGAVTDGPIANAKVVATLGPQTFSANADAQGRYSVAVKTGNPADFLSVVATGVGTQSAVVLSSLVGEMSGLAALSTNGALTSDTATALQVTHVSAAVTGLLAQAGALPATDAALSDAMQKIYLQDVLEAATLVKLVVDGGVSLPEGVSTTQALLASSTAVKNLGSAQRASNSTAFYAARDGVTTDSSLQRSPPVPIGNAAPAVTWVYTSEIGGAAPTATQVTLVNDGTATVVDDAVHAATWKLIGTQLKLIYAEPVVVTTFSSAVGADGLQWMIDRVITGLTLGDLGIRSGRYTSAVVYLDNYQLERGGPKAGVKQTLNGGLVMRRHDVSKLPAIQAEDLVVGKRWAGLYSSHDLSGTYKQDVLAITGVNSALMERTKVAAAWRLVDGALEVTLPGFNYRYRRLGLGSLGEERWLMEQRVAGELLAVREIMAVPGTDVNIDATQLSRRWESNLNAIGGSRINSAFLLRGDGMASSTFSDANALETTTGYDRTWSVLPSGQVEILTARTRTANAICKPTPTDTNCTVRTTRNWRFVARVGTKLFTIEQAPYSPGRTEESQSYRFMVLTDTGEVK
jgi:hypothetical protein